MPDTLEPGLPVRGFALLSSSSPVPDLRRDRFIYGAAQGEKMGQDVTPCETD